ncbi:DUF4129 domain-containing protein [Haloprofundus salilacus]|uniref:DUF4129 domain-containing protein n=1 Tax=Haloprofundus salilacus TaxID=2876190 RepID=UPI001CCDDD4D|nr:DUF4129 domain-containing protein [Haloprofundus salilacus]
MNRDGLLAIAVAVCCLFSLGTAAGTLDSSVQTDPDDVIDLDSSMLPIGSEQADELKQQVADPSQSGDAEASADSESSDSDAGWEQAEEILEAERQEAQQEQQQQQEQQSQSQSESGTGDSVPEEPSLWERLLAFLEAMLPFAVLFGLLVAAYTYRDRLAALVGRWFPTSDDGSSTTDEPVGDPKPKDDVSAAWCEMLASVGLERETKLTPRERGEKVAERGEDAEAVWGLTSLYENVRYGGAAVTDERRQRARDYLRRFRGNSGGDR